MAKDQNGNPIKLRSLVDFEGPLPQPNDQFVLYGSWPFLTDTVSGTTKELKTGEVVTLIGLERLPSGSVNGPDQVWVKFQDSEGTLCYFSYDFTQWDLFRPL